MLQVPQQHHFSAQLPDLALHIQFSAITKINFLFRNMLQIYVIS